MIDRTWYDRYLARYRQSLFETDVFDACCQFRDFAVRIQESGAKLIFAGNGASAAIASHVSVDFTKQAGVTAINFNEPDLITCLSNDYGYENWIAEAIKLYATPQDAVVLISSSGRSDNMVAAAKYVRQRGLPLITFTGFAADNPLRSLGEVNFWLDSRSYNVVECTHMIWITMVIDMVIGRAEYSVTSSSE